MTYLSWAVYYEGPTDQLYFDLLIPRVMEDIILNLGVRNSTIPPDPAVKFGRGTVHDVAREACEAREAFHVVFIHADTGGRALESRLDERSTSYCDAMNTICCFPPRRCITISPRHETEAWILADPEAVTAALGYRGSPSTLGLPTSAAEAERLNDPKAILAIAVRQVRKGRAVDLKQIFPSIAQRQKLPELRQARSFANFEKKLLAALADLGCISNSSTNCE